jgi:hypothetical protein
VAELASKLAAAEEQIRRLLPQGGDATTS